MNWVRLKRCVVVVMAGRDLGLRQSRSVGDSGNSGNRFGTSSSKGGARSCEMDGERCRDFGHITSDVRGVVKGFERRSETG